MEPWGRGTWKLITLELKSQVPVRANVSSASESDTQWYITLQNVALGMNKPLRFHLRLACHSNYACPAPLLRANGQPGPQCAGHGTCAAPSAAFLASASSGRRQTSGNVTAVSANNRADTDAGVGSASGAAAASGHSGGGRDDNGSSSGDGEGVILAAPEPVLVAPRVCTCKSGYGDVGCDVPVAPLARGRVTSRVVPVGGWTYFALDVSGLAIILDPCLLPGCAAQPRLRVPALDSATISASYSLSTPLVACNAAAGAGVRGAGGDEPQQRHQSRSGDFDIINA